MCKILHYFYGVRWLNGSAPGCEPTVPGLNPASLNLQEHASSWLVGQQGLHSNCRLVSEGWQRQKIYKKININKDFTLYWVLLPISHTWATACEWWGMSNESEKWHIQCIYLLSYYILWLLLLFYNICIYTHAIVRVFSTSCFCWLHLHPWQSEILYMKINTYIEKNESIGII